MLIAIFALTGLLIWLFLRARDHEKNLAIKEHLKTTQVHKKSSPDSRPAFFKNKEVPRFARTKKGLLIATLLSSIICSIGFYVTMDSTLIGLTAGLALPLVIGYCWNAFYLYRYTEDFRQAAESADAVFGSGGSFEDWLRDTIPHLTGPLRAAFELGVENLKAQIPVTRTLEQIIHDCPIPYFTQIWKGFHQLATNAGDMRTFLQDIQDDMIQREKMIRRMDALRTRGFMSAAVVVGFPLELYLLFRNIIFQILINHPITILVLGIGVAGIGLLLFLIYYVSKPERN